MGREPDGLKLARLDLDKDQNGGTFRLPTVPCLPDLFRQEESMNITHFDGLRLSARARFTFSRRQFVRTTAGAMAAGAALGHAIWPGAVRAAKSAGEPLPIPGGTPVLGGGFHVYGPGAPGLDPVSAEPSTITDFNGFVGLAYISGTVKRTNNSTGEIAELPFLGSDMRFMQGVFRGADGRVRRGTFGFI
jgi:hypothetical protein